MAAESGHAFDFVTLGSAAPHMTRTLEAVVANEKNVASVFSLSSDFWSSLISRMGVSHLAPGESRNLGVRLPPAAGQLQTAVCSWSQGTALPQAAVYAGGAVGHDETSLRVQWLRL